MKKWIGILIIILSMLMTGCKTRNIVLEYEHTGTYLNDYEIVRITVKKSTSGYCKAFTTVEFEVDSTSNLEFTYGCMGDGIFLDIGEEYMRLDKAVKEDYIAVSDLVDADVGTIEYNLTVQEFLDIELDDFVVSELNVWDLDGFIDYYPTHLYYSWDVTLASVKDYITPLLSQKVENNLHCTDTLCILFGENAGVQLELVSESSEMTISVFEHWINIVLHKDGVDYRVFHVDKNYDEEVELYTYLVGVHLLNKSNSE